MASHKDNNNGNNTVPLTLERKLELLESRFTKPAAGTVDPLQQLVITTNDCSASYSSSQHSLSFTASNSPSSQSNLPSSAVRSKRRPSITTSLHAVERATARHLRKLAANSPVHGNSNNNNTSSRMSSPSSASQQTLVTSHVRTLTDTPPAPVTPGIVTTPVRPHSPKPAAARNILNAQPSNNSRSSTATSTSHNNAHTPTSSSATKRKSVPKRKHASIKDRSQIITSTGSTNSNSNLGSSEGGSKRRKEEPYHRSSHISENSRDRSNPPRSHTATNIIIPNTPNTTTTTANTTTTKRTSAPTNNRSIHDFFALHKKKEALEDAVISSSSSTTMMMMNNDVTMVDWVAKCNKLQQLLQDKDEQLKAVTNNKTILHTALQAALEKTKKELTTTKAKIAERDEATSRVLEDLLRWKSNQQAKDLREKLAADGARLGRIVYARTGMRAVESWEEGYATKDLEQRKLELTKKRKTLQARADSLKNKEAGTDVEGSPLLELIEARESIRMHLENLTHQETELAQEEQALNDEKGAHIRALKRVASEDASRFRSRPKLNDRYVLHCLLGKGGFSEVWRGYDLVELREVAVKIHQLDPRWPDSKKENYTKHVSREYEIHRNVRHPRIVSLYDVFEIDNNSFATVLECCKGTDLDTLLKSKKRLPERQARALLLQILSGMSYLSQPSGSRQGIIHYDLKPGNILFDELGDAKITDFGLSKIVDAHDPGESMELTSQGAGTYWYLPPECFITTEQVRISNKVDVWSIGVIYFQMLYGFRPFGEGKTQDKLLADHTMLNAHQVQFPDCPDVSEEGKGFIQQCLMYDQAFRPTIAQLCEHPYVLNYQFTDY